MSAKPKRNDLQWLSSEEHRRECEARFVLSLEKQKRREYLELVRSKRGEAGADVLKADVERMYARSRSF